MSETPKVIDNKPKTYLITLRRRQARLLWLKVQQAKDHTRSIATWLSAANEELRKPADIKELSVRIMETPMDKLEELIQTEFSTVCISGIREACVQFIKAGAKDGDRASFRDQLEVLDACLPFGMRFVDNVKKLSAPPETPSPKESDEIDKLLGEARDMPDDEIPS